jgi:membrane protein DedA with SNARE-associated domain
MLAELIVNYVTAFISAVSYAGIFVLMFLESTMIPLPSELVMPFAGFLVALEQMNLWAAIIFATLGSLAGSLFGYWLGHRFSGRLVRKFGKYFLLNKEHLAKAQKYFKSHGNKTIFFSRFIPGIRHVISVPAGAGKMNLKKFSVLTVLGAGIWNTFLLYLGYILQKNWQTVYRYSGYVDMIVIAIIALLLVYYIYKIIDTKKA